MTQSSKRGYTQAEGLILDMRPSQEKDRSVEILTPLLGKIWASARGARNIHSKFIGEIQTMNICEITLYFNGKEHWTITEAKIKKSFQEIKKDLQKIQPALKILETLKGINEGSEYENLYRTGEKALTDIENCNDSKSMNLDTIFEIFLIQFLDKVGSMPEITHCEKCHTKIEFSKERIWNPLETTCEKCDQKNSNHQYYTETKYHDRYRKLIHFLKKNTYEEAKKIRIEKSDRKILTEIGKKYWISAGNEELKSATIDIHAGLLIPVRAG